VFSLVEGSLLKNNVVDPELIYGVRTTLLLILSHRATKYFPKRFLGDFRRRYIVLRVVTRQLLRFDNQTACTRTRTIYMCFDNNRVLIICRLSKTSKPKNPIAS